MKKVLWIDDSPKDLNCIVEPVVKKLWENEIKSEMYIVGDFTKENFNMSDSEYRETINHLNKIIASEFINYLIEKDFIYDNKISEEKYELINNDPDSELFLTAISNVANTEIDGVSISDDIIKSWKELDTNIFITNSGTEGEKIDYSSVPDKLNEYNLLNETINAIINDIQKSYSAVFIDMCLFKGDYTKLCDKKNRDYNYEYMIPIFSMALYNAAKNNNFNAYMYTSHTKKENLVSYWIETYNLIFSQEGNPKAVDFYNRKGKNTSKNELLCERVIKDLND